MASQKESTSMIARRNQFGESNISKWDEIHYLADLIKKKQAKIVKDSNGVLYTKIM